MNRCRKCGKPIGESKKGNVVIWCGTCRKEVDRELSGQQDKPLGFYFDYYWKYGYRRN